MSKYFRIKSIDAILSDAQDENGEQSFSRVLGLPSLLALGIGAILGAGVFVLTGTAAAQYAGPSLIISFIIAAIACAFAGLCYSEFSASIPVAGSAYTYGYATLGEVVAFVIGLDCILEYAFGAAAVSAGWSGYCYSLMQDLLGQVSPKFVASPGTEYVLWQNRWEPVNAVSQTIADAGVNMASLPHEIAVCNLLSLFIVALITFLLVMGVRLSTTINSVIVFLKIFLVLIFVCLTGSFLMHNPDIALQNWTPFIPENTGKFGEFGWSGIARGAAVLFFAYVGFDCVSTAAQEARNPSRDIPLAIVGSLLVCTLAYIAVCGMLTGIINYTQLNVADPAARGIDATGVTWGILFIKLGLVVGLLSGVLVLTMSLSRVIYSMANDGLLPASLSKIHPKFHTPWIATITVGLVVAALTAFFPIGDLADLVSLGALMAFIIVCIGVLILRKKYPDRPRQFSTPGVPFVPIMGALISFALMISLPLSSWIPFLGCLALGLVGYFCYSVKHSKLDKEMPNS